jgi:hypothetical protein
LDLPVWQTSDGWKRNRAAKPATGFPGSWLLSARFQSIRQSGTECRDFRRISDKVLCRYPKTQIIYDATVRFRDRFISRRSRTQDQMVQAARSGNKNIAEGSQVSGTSKESEIKLEQDFLNEGGLRERMTRARLASRSRQQRGGHT